MASALSIGYVPPERIPASWEALGPVLKRATDLSGGRYTVDDLYQKLTAGEYQLWVVVEEGRLVAANTVRLAQYPQMRVLEGFFIAGDRLLEWKDQMCAEMERLAQALGCQIIEFNGRRGWGKVLSENGYHEQFVTYSKVVDGPLPPVERRH